MKKSQKLSTSLHCNKTRKQRNNWHKKPLMLLLMAICNIAIVFGQAPTKTISGKVSDSAGIGLPGVNITLKGTTNGTVTDIDGVYSISANSENVIVFSFIGFDTQEIPVGDQTSINITMLENAQSVDEVVVIGYGSIKKSDVTGSVSGIDMDQMETKNVVNVSEGLQGLAAGVQVTRASGKPGDKARVTIRGTATISNETQPLYVVDGIMVGTDADFLNPNDIESMEVMKDASSTAIYGSRGANGVIMITTKKGIKGKTNLTVKADFGLQTPGNKINVSNATEFSKIANQLAANDGFDPNPDWADPSKINSIDWQDEMTQSTLRQQYFISATGGSENMQASMSVGYLKDEGVIRATNFERLTTRANINYKVNDFIKTGINMAFTREDSEGDGNMFDYAFLVPTMDYHDGSGYVNVPVQYSDGSYGIFPQYNEVMKGEYINADQDNPVAIAETAEAPRYSNRLLTSAFLDIQFTKALSFKTVGGLNHIGTGGNYYNAIHNRTINSPKEDQFGLDQYTSTEYLLENYITYDKTLGNHHLNAVAGISYQESKSQEVNTSGKLFATSNIRDISFTQDPTTISGGGKLGLTSKMFSTFGRLNYSFLDRYIVTGTIRRDGSTYFGGDNKFGTFPSASFAWRIIEEDFMKNSSVFSNFKLRTGWGQTGNAGGSTNKYKRQLSSERVRYFFYDYDNPTAHTVVPGLAEEIEVDPDLKWETNEQINIGLDLGLLNNNLTFTFDYFQRDAKDLLLLEQLRPSTGFKQIYTNSGHIRNKGYEFSLIYQKKFDDWRINMQFNGSHVKSEAINVGDEIFFGDGSTDYDDIVEGYYWENYSITRNSHPVGSYFGYKTDGIFQTQAEINALNATSPNGVYQANAAPGDFKYVDINNDGEINASDKDVIGNGYPDFVYGFNFSLGWKNFDFSLSGHGVVGQDILSYAYMNLHNGVHRSRHGIQNVSPEYANNSWNGDGSTNKYNRITALDPNHNTQVSDAYIKKGDFLKIQSLQIGYTLPKNVQEQLKLSSARVYFNINNVATFSKYNDYGDPEVGNSDPRATGFDKGRYPFPRIYTMGLSLGF